MKELDWDNVLTAHRGMISTKTWSTSRKAIGKHTLLHTTDKSVNRKEAVTAVAVSQSGHFGAQGTLLGRIDLFSMQSGMHRQTYQGHKKEITGLSIDSTDATLMSTSLDQTLRVWSLLEGTLLHTISLPYPCTGLAHQRESALCAVATRSPRNTVFMIDPATHNIVRQFNADDQPIRDMTISYDGRWLITGDAKGVIRTWDIPTSTMVDWFQCVSPLTSLSLNQKSDVLATTHENEVGISLWYILVFFIFILFAFDTEINHYVQTVGQTKALTCHYH